MKRLVVPFFGISMISLLAGLLCAAPAGKEPAEISGLLDLRVNNCFNPDHVGPHETYVVRDGGTRFETELDVDGIDKSQLKPGRNVRMTGRFKANADGSGRGSQFQVTGVTYEAAAEPSKDGKAPPTAGAPAVTELSVLVIHANALDHPVDTSKINSMSNLLFEGTQNAAAAIEACSYGHYRLVHSNTIVVDVSINATGTSYTTMATEMENEAKNAGYDPANYDRYLVCCPNGVTGIPTAYGYYYSGKTVWSYSWTGRFFDGIIHELGHNFGFRHSGQGTGEYNDKTCVMGVSHSMTAGPRQTSTYSAIKKFQDGWFDPYPGSYTSITSDATFDIHPISVNPDDAPGMRAVRLGSSDNFVSYRRYLLPYAWLRNSGDADKVYVHNAVYTGPYFETSWRLSGLTEGNSYGVGTTNVIFELYGTSSNSYAAVSIDFPDGNTKPTADAQAVEAYVDTPAAITLTGSDPEDALTYSVYIAPTNGSISGTAPNITYTPTNGYTGPDSFVFRVDDGQISSFATVSITVTMPEVSVTATDAAASETGPDGGEWAITRVGSTGLALNVIFSLGGTATETDDYSIDTTSPVTIPAGQTNVTITLTTVDDSVPGEGSETVDLIITPDAAYSIGTGTGTVTIADNDFVAPAVSNYGTTALSDTSASVSGWVSSGGVVEAWICWGSTDGGAASTGDWDNVVAMGPVNVGTEFSTNITGLSTNSTYWYRCYVTNTSGTAWSPSAGTFSGTAVGGGGPASDTELPISDVFCHNEKGNFGGIPGDMIAGTGMNGNPDNYSGSWPTNEPSLWTATDSGYKSEWQSAALVNSATSANSKIGWAIFDVGASYTLKDFYLWNERENSGRITATFNVYVAETPAVSPPHGPTDNTAIDYDFAGGGWTKINGPVLTGSWRGDQVVSLGSVDARYVAVEILTNGGDANKVGLAEVGIVATISAGPALGNEAPTDITNTGAVLNAALDASGTNYDVYVYYGASDGGSNAGAWASSDYVGSWTNVSTGLSYTASLAGGQTYYYTFQGSNSSGQIWATPSWQFNTLPAGAVTTNHYVPHSWLASQNPAWTNDYEAAVTNDHDSDGFTTAQEYWSGTDPQDGSSYLRIENVGTISSNVNLVWVHSQADAGLPPIVIQWRSSMLTGAWSYAGQNTPSNGTNSWDALMQQGGYYRLAVTNMP